MEDKLEKLNTPFGEITIMIDGQPIDYTAQKGSDNDILWPDVTERYQIEIRYVPDGKEHNLSCVFLPVCSYEKSPESGERLECQSFYGLQSVKMSIGLECEAGYIEGVRASDEYDYDADYLDQGRVIGPGSSGLIMCPISNHPGTLKGAALFEFKRNTESITYYSTIHGIA